MATPNIQTVDLTQFRESPSLTSDVSFIFKDQTTGQVRELLAHKFVLGVGSEVFMAQFYGTFKEKRDAIPIEDSSYSAFKLLLDILYNRNFSLKGVELKLIAELYYLADKYLMGKVQDTLVAEISSKKINSEELLVVAKVAEENLHLEKFSSSLYITCVKFVKENMGKVLEIFDEEEAGGENSILLHKLMAKASSNSHHRETEVLRGYLEKLGLKYNDAVTRSCRSTKGMVICEMTCKVDTKTSFNAKLARHSRDVAIVAAVREITGKVKNKFFPGNSECDKELIDQKQALMDLCELTNRPEPCFSSWLHSSWLENGLYCAGVKVGEEEATGSEAYRILAEAEGSAAKLWLSMFGDIVKSESKKVFLESKRRRKRVSSFFCSLDNK